MEQLQLYQVVINWNKASVYTSLVHTEDHGAITLVISMLFGAQFLC